MKSKNVAASCPLPASFAPRTEPLFNLRPLLSGFRGMALPLTALLALVLDADPWFVSLAIQAESFLKCPICLWRIRSRKWIHDVTLPEGRRDD